MIVLLTYILLLALTSLEFSPAIVGAAAFVDLITTGAAVEILSGNSEENNLTEYL